MKEKTAIASAFEEAQKTVEDAVKASTEKPKRVLSAIAAEPWAIEERALRSIVEIATRCHEKPEALEAIRGQPVAGSRAMTKRGNIAVIPIIGPVFPRANMFTEISGATSLQATALDFNKADSDPEVDQIILEMDTPGGQVTGVADFAEMVRGAQTPVTAFVGGQANSAGYWIASAAKQIVLSPTAVVGSVGAMVEVIPSDSDGYVFRSTQSPLKNPDPSSEEGAAEYQTHADSVAQVFIEDVARYRNVSVETVLSDFGRGGVLVGAKAVAAGMADRVASVETVIAGFSGQNGVEPMSDDIKPAAVEMTAELLASEHPAIYAAIRAEAATKERERIQGVLSATLPGHEELVNKLAFDGKTTKAEAALEILQAEASARATALSDLKAKGDLKVESLPEQDEGIDEGASVEEKCAHLWKKDPKVRDEFTSLEVFTACVKGEKTHNVRHVGG